ncbi:MAG: hypothetical protein L0Z07_08850, partial [Planctomycetes bacterium]|nr:hypothetical protein [Planctomycetota bacterium]
MQLQPANWVLVLNGMLVLCGLAALIAFAVVKNRPWVAVAQERARPGERIDFAVVKNRPWVAVFTVSLVLFILSVASVLFSLVMVQHQVTVIPGEMSLAVLEDRLTAPRIPLGPPDAPAPPGKPGDEPAPNQQEKVAAADAAKELSAARALIAQTVQAINLAIDEYKRITTAGAPPKITVAPPAAALEAPPVA